MDSWSVFGRIALARFKVVPGDAGRTGCSQDIGQALISPPCRALRVSRAEAGGRPTFPRAMCLAQQNIGAGSALHDRLSKAELPQRYRTGRHRDDAPTGAPRRRIAYLPTHGPRVMLVPRCFQGSASDAARPLHITPRIVYQTRAPLIMRGGANCNGPRRRANRNSCRCAAEATGQGRGSRLWDAAARGQPAGSQSAGSHWSRGAHARRHGRTGASRVLRVV